MEEIKKKAREMFDEKFKELNGKTEIWKGNRPPSHTDIKSFIDKIIDLAVSKEREKTIDENTSDGYHTFKELYEFRKIYNACLFNEWSEQRKFYVHKSERHSDGELCFGGGWFIVVATLPTGDISNHYEMKDWDLFQCRAEEKAKEWDGHTAKDVVERLSNLINTK